RQHLLRPNWEVVSRSAHTDSTRNATRILLAATMSLCLLCSAVSLPAQAPPATSVPGAAPHESVTPHRAAAGKKSGNMSPAAPSAIQFENVIERSKIKFTLRNSVSPQRYTFETMAGGVALFDYNNDGLLDIFFTIYGSIPALRYINSIYSYRLIHNY